jgi:hypothetical protein
MLPRIQIASPCSASWDRMPGNDRVRHCPECNLDVYNFSAMSRADIEHIVASHEGRLCARFYQRADGTMLTQNCPVGLRAAVLRASRAATALLTAIMSAGPAMARSVPRLQNSSLVQIQQQRGLTLIVSDPMGAVIPNARVTVSNTATGQTIEAQTDQAGQLKMPEVPAGDYAISIVVTGFATKHERVSLPASAPLQLKMDVAVMGEIVEVQNPHPSPLSRVFTAFKRIF